MSKLETLESKKFWEWLAYIKLELKLTKYKIEQDGRK